MYSDELAGATQQEFHHCITSYQQEYAFIDLFYGGVTAGDEVEAFRITHSCRSYYSATSMRMNNSNVIRSLRGQLDL